MLFLHKLFFKFIITHTKQNYNINLSVCRKINFIMEYLVFIMYKNKSKKYNNIHKNTKNKIHFKTKSDKKYGFWSK